MMPRFSRPIRRIGQGLLLGVACALFVLLTGSFDFFKSLERGTLNSLFLSRGAISASPAIVLVEADDATVQSYGAWPLPRSLYADLIDRLSRAGAKTIALDVMFPVPSGSREDDEHLVRAAASSRRVVQGCVFFGAPTQGASTEQVPLQQIAPKNSNPAQSAVRPILPRFGLPDSSFVPPDANIDWGMAPFAPLQNAVAGVGHLNAQPDADGVLRRISHLMRWKQATGTKTTTGTALYPSLSLAAAAHFLDVSPRQIQVRPGEIVLPAASGECHIPLDEQGLTWVNWIGKPQSFYTFSLGAVLRGEVPDAQFKGKIVLVGSTAAGAYEFRASPFSQVQPAVEFQASALNDILLRRPLRGSSNSLWLLMRFALPALIGALTLSFSTKVSGFSTFGLCGALWFAAFWLFSQEQIVLLIATPILGAVLAWSVGIALRQWSDSQNLRRAEERYSLAVRGANDGLWDWDLKTGEVYYSPRWKGMVGHHNGEIGASIDEWHSRVHPDDVEQMKAQLHAHLSGGVAHFESQHRMKHRDGRWVWVLSRGLRVCGADGKPARMAGSQSDISVQVEANAQLEHNAFYDALTGLPNRALFMDVLGRALSRAQRSGSNSIANSGTGANFGAGANFGGARPAAGFAVLFMDLDRFKTINDSLGHQAGDEFLKVVAQRIAGCLWPGDLAARLGGDEFTVMLDDIEEAGAATRRAEAIQETLSQPFSIGGQEVFASSSIGIALSAPHYQRAEELIRDADTAMYRAKASGRAHHAVFDEAMHAQAIEVLRLETDLRRAVERHEFTAYYQPIVSLESAEIVGFEALIRWNHPERGLVSPAQFVPLAEETGLIITLDYLVLRQACAQLRAWQGKFPRRQLTMSANLSSKQLAQADLVTQIARIVMDTGASPDDLRLEITEGVLMDNAQNAAAMLHQMRALGLRFAIDDFGTGYSSLAYLHSFPLDTLKIDQSFVRRIMPGGQNLEIVNTIVSLARNLNMNVVAEGIETWEQWQQLRSLSCDLGQGFLFSRPLPAHEIEALLEKGEPWIVREADEVLVG